LREVSSEILRKCGGIISIAGLLANRSKTTEAWGNTLKSISAAADKDSPIDKMKRILLLSYFDLPPHLKSCLSYLSVFPKDKSMLYNHQANPIYDSKSLHRVTGTSYAWLRLTNMKDNKTLTQKET
jgi:hypothetical protein